MNKSSDPDNIRRATATYAQALPNKPRLRRFEAADYLMRTFGIEISPATLAKYACNGLGPCFQRAGRVPLYPTHELDRWAERRLGPLLRHTSSS